MPSAISDDVQDTPSMVVVKELPFEFHSYVKSYLDEQLYEPSFALIHQLLVSGADRSSGKQRIAYLPASQITALASTMIIHPSTTTRIPPDGDPQAANDALRYLQHLKTVSPLDYGMSSIFTFANSDPQRQSRLRRRRSIDDSLDSKQKDDYAKMLKMRMATSDSVYEKVDDFWSVVGWAFNCSVKYPARWDRYQVWLEVMLDLLEVDFDDRVVASNSMPTDSADDEPPNPLAEALITKYLTLPTSTRMDKKRVIRAILADGSQQDLQLFKEIWKDEIKPLKEATDEKESQQIDIDNDIWGDYMDVEENLEPEPGRRRSGRQRRPEGGDDEEAADDSTLTQTIADFGGIRSISLRLRLLALLIHSASKHPTGFIGLVQLFEICADPIRSLPLHVFSQFVLPTVPWTEPDAHCALMLDILVIMTGCQPPAFKLGVIQQDDLERHYLPATASGANIVDNAKVSLMVESLMRLLWRHGKLEARASLSEAVDAGRRARFEKIKFDGRRKTGASVQQALQAEKVLAESAKRMATLQYVIQASAD